MSSLPRPRPLGAAALVAGLLACSPTRAAEDPVPPEVYERGERTMRRFCLSCHGVPGGKVEDPLGPRLRPELWSDPEQAYQNVGQLWRINRRMDQPFAGDEAERRALSLWLSRRARENVVPPWRAAAPWVATAVVALASFGLFVRMARRNAGRRSR